MEVTAAILLFLGAVFGFISFVHLGMDMKTPKMIRLLHVVFVVLGIAALITYALTTESNVKHYNVLVILGIAMLPALWILFGSTVKGLKKALATVYALIGMFGLFWLLTFVIP